MQDIAQLNQRKMGYAFLCLKISSLNYNALLPSSRNMTKKKNLERTKGTPYNQLNDRSLSAGNVFNIFFFKIIQQQ